MGSYIQVGGLVKSFGLQRVWEDVTINRRAGQVSMPRAPWGCGRTWKEVHRDGASPRDASR